MDIISVLTVDKRQTDRKSVDMEKVAFIKTFDSLMSELDIKEIVTDAHVQIAALMRKNKLFTCVIKFECIFLSFFSCLVVSLQIPRGGGTRTAVSSILWMYGMQQRTSPKNFTL